MCFRPAQQRANERRVSNGFCGHSEEQERRKTYSEAKMKPFMQIGIAIALGAIAAIAVAGIIGGGAAWLTVGIVIGITLGAAFPRRHAEAVNHQRHMTKD